MKSSIVSTVEKGTVGSYGSVPIDRTVLTALLTAVMIVAMYFAVAWATATATRAALQIQRAVDGTSSVVAPVASVRR